MKKLILALIIFTGCTKEAAKEVTPDRSKDKIEILEVRRTIFIDKTYDSVWYKFHKVTGATFFTIYCGANQSFGTSWGSTVYPIVTQPKENEVGEIFARLNTANKYRTDFHFVVYYDKTEGVLKDSLVAPVYTVTNIKYR